jgi:hypothetical protein
MSLDFSGRLWPHYYGDGHGHGYVRDAEPRAVPSRAGAAFMVESTVVQ